MMEQLDIFFDGFKRVVKYLAIAFISIVIIKKVAAGIVNFIQNVVFEDPLLYLVVMLLIVIFIIFCYVVGYENKNKE